ncbi:MULTISPECIES: hypothetical protein [unclassified Ensifer]|uniref:hypothetical protein n=1 Tax=unclassified Ensifer TaxID=2633371 RepID=UPI000A83ED25|nr:MULTISPECIES: hypothetical protein [unclassified Ensifer]
MPMDNCYDRDLTGKIKKIAGLMANDNWFYDYDLRGRLVSADNAGNKPSTKPMLMPPTTT